jgi:hypothetical protein
MRCVSVSLSGSGKTRHAFAQVKPGFRDVYAYNYWLMLSCILPVPGAHPGRLDPGLVLHPDVNPGGES